MVAKEKAANEAKSEFMSLMCHEVRSCVQLLADCNGGLAAWRTCCRRGLIQLLALSWGVQQGKGVLLAGL